MHSIRLLVASLLIAIGVPHARAQTSLVTAISAEMMRSFMSNLYANTGQNRGFTKIRDPLVARTPTNQHDLARDYIQSAFTGMGLTTRRDPFSFATYFGAPPSYYYTGCNNIVATLPGLAPRTFGTYIVGAFYDTVDRGQPLPTNLSAGWASKSPGADLNASGVACLLAVANALSRQRLMATIVFVAFDASEKNFNGSYYFARKKTTANPAKTNKILRAEIRGMISLDTVGYNLRDADYNTAALYGGTVKPDRLRKRLAAALAVYGGIKTYQRGTTSSSDHVPFIHFGIPACVLSESRIWENPFIYTSADSFSKANYLDFEFMSRIARGVTGFLIEQAVLTAPLTTTVVGNGTVTAGGWQAWGSEVAVKAVPALLWKFHRWEGDTNNCTILDTTLLARMTQPRHIRAVFSLPSADGASLD
ncbi:MAG: M28 family peptidase [Kiritimatiellia bacterium]